MNKKSSNAITRFFKGFTKEIAVFLEFLFYYGKRKVINWSVRFEKNKNRLVKFFLMKRGRYNRPFLHIATMGVLGIGVLIAPMLADTYPIFASKASAVDLVNANVSKQSVLAGEEVFQTQTTQIRSKIITYTVENGDTISTIAKKFGISEDTIRWANNLSDDGLSVGQQLQILPVTGIAYKVQGGDSIYSIAKTFDVDPQAIVNWEFNDFANPETFALVVGQMLIVPDGVKPSEQSTYKSIREEQIKQYYAGPVAAAGGGWVWPVSGLITQYASWYHMALDIAGSIGSPVGAAHAGTVSRVSVGTYDTGYGNNVWIDDGDGIKTHYAHLNSVAVSVGQTVSAGQTIGYRGNTGRSTGPHTHFEVQVNGALVNPLGYVRP